MILIIDVNDIAKFNGQLFESYISLKSEIQTISCIDS